MDLRAWLLLVTLVRSQVNLLIETHELSTWLRDNRVICLLEVVGLGETSDPNLDKRIPGTKTLLLKDILDQKALPEVKIPDQNAFIAQMKRYSITKDTTVILYDKKGMRFASMVWWIMNFYGRGAKSMVLSGGLPKWQREGYATVAEPIPLGNNPNPVNEALYQYSADLTKLWSSGEIHSMQTTPQPFVQVLDVRPRSDYVQLSIQASINMPIDIINRADGGLRSSRELRSIFEGYNVKVTDEFKTVVVSGTGINASAAILALGVIGKGNCALLDGGWKAYVNWLKMKDAPPLSPPIIVQPVSSEPAPPPTTPTAPVPTPAVPSAPAGPTLLSDTPASQTVNLKAAGSLSTSQVFLSCLERCSSFCSDFACEQRCAESFCDESPATMLGAAELLALVLICLGCLVFYWLVTKPGSATRLEKRP